MLFLLSHGRSCMAQQTKKDECHPHISHHHKTLEEHTIMKAQELPCVHQQLESLPNTHHYANPLCSKQRKSQNRVVRVLVALGEAVAKRFAGLVLWLIQPVLVLFLRSVPPLTLLMPLFGSYAIAHHQSSCIRGPPRQARFQSATLTTSACVVLIAATQTAPPEIRTRCKTHLQASCVA